MALIEKSCIIQPKQFNVTCYGNNQIIISKQEDKLHHVILNFFWPSNGYNWEQMLSEKNIGGSVFADQRMLKLSSRCSSRHIGCIAQEKIPDQFSFHIYQV